MSTHQRENDRENMDRTEIITVPDANDTCTPNTNICRVSASVIEKLETEKLNKEGEELLTANKVIDFNKLRAKNPGWKPDLRCVDLRQAQLMHVNLIDANLENAMLIGCDLSDARLDRANLKRANLFSSKLTLAILRGANLEEANLKRAVLTETNFENANLHRAILALVQASFANFAKTNLTETDFTDATLNNSDFADAIITSSTNFRNVNLASVKNLKRA